MQIFDEKMKEMYYRFKELNEKIVVAEGNGQILFASDVMKRDFLDDDVKTINQLFGDKLQEKLMQSFKIRVPFSDNTILKRKNYTIAMAPCQESMIIRLIETTEHDVNLPTVKALMFAEQEVRCALASMTASVDYMKKHEKANENNPIIEKNIAIVNKGIHRVLRIISDVSDVVKYNSGNIMLNSDVGDLKKCFEEVFEKMLPLFEKMKIKFTCQKPKASIIMLFDREKIKSMLYGLLNNACKAKNNDQYIDVDMSIEGKTVITKIRYGADKEILESPVYEPTVRFAVASNIAKLHGGDIELTNNQNYEIVVTVSLPISLKAQNDIMFASDIPEYVGGFDIFKLEMSDLLDTDMF